MSSSPSADLTKVASSNDMILAYTALGVQAVVPILLGSFASVKTPKWIRKRVRARKAAATPKHLRTIDPDDPDSLYADEPETRSNRSGHGKSTSGANEDEDDETDIEEWMTFQESLLMPVIGSAVLGSLYLVIKYGGVEWVNRVLGVYFAFAGIPAFQSIINGVFGLLRIKRGPRYHIRIEHGFKQIFHASFNKTTLFVIPFAIALPLAFIILDKPWYLANLLGFVFAASAISLLKLEGFKAGAALLAGLFLYDIFWVFYTPVMVTVAKGIDAPIKVVAPKQFGNAAAGFTMLGLGDIVVPGSFVSLALRYDYASHVQRMTNSNKDALPQSSEPYPKPYFIAVLVAYVLGLVTTVTVMHQFQAAQPALLYLSPACIGSVVLLSLIRGEFKQMLNWSDGEPEAKKTPSEESDVNSLPEASVRLDEASPVAPDSTTANDPVKTESKPESEDDEWLKHGDDGSAGHAERSKKKKGGKKRK